MAERVVHFETVTTTRYWTFDDDGEKVWLPHQHGEVNRSESGQLTPAQAETMLPSHLKAATPDTQGENDA